VGVRVCVCVQQTAAVYRRPWHSSDWRRDHTDTDAFWSVVSSSCQSTISRLQPPPAVCWQCHSTRWQVHTLSDVSIDVWHV